MTDFDPEEFGRSVGDLIREIVDPLLKRIEQLEERQPERGEKGDPGNNAPPADLSVFDARISQIEGALDLKKTADQIVRDQLNAARTKSLSSRISELIGMQIQIDE